MNRAIHNSDTIARSVPVPPHFVSPPASPLVSAGGAKSVSFLVASRAAAIRLASLARFAPPAPPLVSDPWLALGSAVNGRNGK